MSSAMLPHLRQARDLADRCSGEHLDLGVLAARAGMSKFHFVRSFAAAYGETPMRYVTRRRIERAQDLLRADEHTVAEISALVGFASLGSFTSRFTTLVGLSPTEYRRRWSSSGGARIPGCYLFRRGIDSWPEERNLGEASPEVALLG